MSPQNNKIEIGEALNVQKVKLHYQITLTTEMREKLGGIELGEGIIVYEGPIDGSILIMPTKTKDSAKSSKK